jgi:hypothetical protein
LVQLRVALDDIDEIEDDTPLAAHDHIEVAQSYVEIDDDGLLAAHGKAGADGGRGGGLADPALARRDDDDFSHCNFSLLMDLFQGLDVQLAVLQKHLHPLLARRRRDVVAGLVEAGDRDQFRFEILAEDARLGVAVDASEHPATHPAVDMDIAPSDELGPGAYRGDDDEIAMLGENLLARAYRLRDQQRAATGGSVASCAEFPAGALLLLSSLGRSRPP